MKKTQREASVRISLLALLVCIVIMAIFGIVVGTDIHVPLTLCCGFLLLYGVFYLHVPFASLSKSMIDGITGGLEVFLLLLLIGSTIGTWISAGTIPLIINYGLSLFSPKFFLLSVLVICSVLSVVTGSSWTTLGTVGIAFMGIGLGLGFNPAVTASAVIIGAYFGDKQSPMSDSTNYAAAVAETGLYDHVRSMLYTTGPAWLVSAVIFTVMGFQHNGDVDMGTVSSIQDGLSGAFHMSPILLLPLLIMIIMIIAKLPAIPTMMISALTGLILTMAFQGADIKSACSYFYSGFVGNTGDAVIDKLLTRGGMSSMYYTIGVMFWSLSMAGLMTSTGIIHAIVKEIQGLTKKRTGLILTHLVSGWLLTAISADIYLSMVLPAKALGKRYDELGLDRSVLSRTCEDSTTIVAPMIPWTTSGVFTATTLGVSVGSYLPYYFLGWFNPIFVLLCCLTGFGMIKAKHPVVTVDDTSEQSVKD